MTYNIIFFGKQTKVIDSVYLFVSQHYTQILHKQLVKDHLLDALLMIYNKSIYTLRYSGIHAQVCTGSLGYLVGSYLWVQLWILGGDLAAGA